MLENSLPIDILLLAFIAVVVLYRLYQKFGTRVDVDDPKDGGDVADKQQFDHTSDQDSSRGQALKDKVLKGSFTRKTNTVDGESLAGKKTLQPLLGDGEAQRIAETIEQGVSAKSLKKIRKIDPSFSVAEFLQGTSIAYDMVTAAIAEGNTRTLRSLTSPELFDSLCADIKQRQQQKQTLEVELIGINAIDIREITVKKTVATAVVAIDSEQSYALYDENRDLIEGDNENVLYLCDLWHLRRDLSSGNPNWTLTRIVEENDQEDGEGQIF